MSNLYFFLLMIILSGEAIGLTGESMVEEFDTRDKWREWEFVGVERKSIFTLTANSLENSLYIQSDSSASALVYQKDIHPYQTPRMRWRWLVHSVLPQVNHATKLGDDYPLRIIVLFFQAPDSLSFFEKLRLTAFQYFVGDFVPHSALGYVWASSQNEECCITSPYTESMKSFVLRSDLDSLGVWVIEERNILKDYERAFGKRPPPHATIAIMSDSDNSKNSTSAALDYLKIQAYETKN